MQMLKQSTVATVLVGPLLDAAGVAVTTAVIGDFNLTKNGTTAAMAAGATATHSHNGHYLISFITGNVDSMGRLVISANNVAHAMTAFRFQVAEANVFDALFGGGDLLKVDVTQFGDTAGVFAAGIPDAKVAGTVTLASSQPSYAPAKAGDAMTLTSGERSATAAVVDAQLLSAGDATDLIASIVSRIGNTNIDEAVLVAAVKAALFEAGSIANKLVVDSSGRVTVGTIAPNAVNASALATDAVTEIQSGLATIANQTSIIDTTSFIASGLFGAIANAGTATETYAITINGGTFTATGVGLDATGNRTSVGLVKS